MKIKEVYSSWKPKKRVFSWTTTAELSTISKRPCLGDTSAAGLSTSKWACLPEDILALILHKLVYLPDYYRFSCVCKSWNSTAMKHRVNRIQGNNHQLPWLLICSRGDDRDGRGRKRSLYNFMTGAETSNLYLRIPDKYMDKRCCGSSHGWLFFLESKYQLIVLNPISGTVIRLPPLIGRHQYEDGVEKALLSGDPFLGSFEVIATDFSSGGVAHLRFGDKIWSYTRVFWSNIDYSSVALYNGRIFAASGSGKMVSMDITSTNDSAFLRTKELKIKSPDVVEKTAPNKLDLEEVAPDELDLEDMSSDSSSESSLDSLPDHTNSFMPDFGDENSEEDMCSSDSDDCDDSEDSCSVSSEDLEDKKSLDSFLVETTKGDLLMVHREWEYGGSPTYSIFKFVVSNHDEQVERSIVEDLEGHSLFLGKNHSISVLASDYSGCRPNSIYYAFWDRYSPFPNYGIEEFNLKDQSVRKHVNMAMSLGPDSSKDNRDVCWIVPSIKL